MDSLGTEHSVIVLGGGGFHRHKSLPRLAASGTRVRAFGRRCLFPGELGGAEWYQGDFTDAAALAAAMETFDIVVHLVNNTTPQAANLDMAGDVQKNVVPTLASARPLPQLKVKRLVFVSSGGTVYGLPEQTPTPESAPTEPITAYGISKLAVEKYLALYERLHGLSYRVLRVANPFGPYQIPIKNQGIIAALISRSLRDESIEIWGDGLVVRDFVFIEDVVDALIAAIRDASSARVFNVGSGEGRSVRDVIAAVGVVLGKEIRVRWQHARPVDIPVSVLSIERARQLLGWEPNVGFEEGLARTIRWWREREAAQDSER